MSRSSDQMMLGSIKYLDVRIPMDNVGRSQNVASVAKTDLLNQFPLRPSAFTSPHSFPSSRLVEGTPLDESLPVQHVPSLGRFVLVIEVGFGCNLSYEWSVVRRYSFSPRVIFAGG